MAAAVVAVSLPAEIEEAAEEGGADAGDGGAGEGLAGGDGIPVVWDGGRRRGFDQCGSMGVGWCRGVGEGPEAQAFDP